MVHNLIRGALVLVIILTIGHFFYAHYFMGNSPIDLLIGIAIVVIGTALIFQAKQDAMTKVVLILSIVVLVYHYIYAHILKGNSPPELVLALIILIPTVAYISMKEIDFKK